LKKAIVNALIINEGKQFTGSVLMEDNMIERVIHDKNQAEIDLSKYDVIDANGKLLIPGVIDDQVHFREPGLTHKASVFTESRAAAAGGVTSYMEMPNTIPPTITHKTLKNKFDIASKDSLVNYSFYMGATNDNIGEIEKVDPKTTCGVKIFMGSSTGNMLVDHDEALSNIFKYSPVLIATHCEDEATIQENTARYIQQYGDNIPIHMHPAIRSAEACYKSSSKAIELATKHGARLHILHISTARETELFDVRKSFNDKKITAEACIHHLWFSDADYNNKGTLIKWNPAVKTTADREKIWEALLANKIDVVATDHAPHTLDEKDNVYTKAPSGGPLIQHSLLAMMDFYKKGTITLEQIVEKMCHNPALLYQIDRRGFIKEGYFADLVLVDLESSTKVTSNSLFYKCGWSPFEDYTFQSKVHQTFVNGQLVYDQGTIVENASAESLIFTR
jgi:dihydroorotase